MTPPLKTTKIRLQWQHDASADGGKHRGKRRKSRGRARGGTEQGSRTHDGPERGHHRIFAFLLAEPRGQGSLPGPEVSLGDRAGALAVRHHAHDFLQRCSSSTGAGRRRKRKER